MKFQLFHSIVFFLKVYWKVARSETHGTGDNQTSRTVIDIYQNKKDYVEQKQHLWGLPLESGQSGWGTQTLPAGNYSMPFQLVLPHDIPFSLEGTIDGMMWLFVIIWKHGKTP